MSRPLHILVIEDSEGDATLLQSTLRRAGYTLTCQEIETPAAMRAALENQTWDVITSDHVMPQFGAPKALAITKQLRPEIPFIIISGEIDINLAVSLMRAGAQDYIPKGELARVVPAIERELHEVELRHERQKADAALVESTARLQEVLEHSLDAVYKRNLRTKSYDFISPAITRVTGYSPEELIQMPDEKALNLLHPD